MYMNKTITKVFLVLGVLLLCLIIWFFVFGSNGVQLAYNGVKDVVNGAYQTVVGEDAELLPEWAGDPAGNLGEAEDNVDTLG